MSLVITDEGLTLGGWFYSDTPGTYCGLMSKFVAAGNQRSYLLDTDTDAPRFFVSTDGSTLKGAVSTVTHDHGVWFFAAGRWTPSTEVAVWCNTTKTVNTTTIPATVYNSTAVFKIGTYDSYFLNGKASLCWLCAAALSDDIIMSIYESQRALFGRGPEDEL